MFKGLVVGMGWKDDFKDSLLETLFGCFLVVMITSH